MMRRTAIVARRKRCAIGFSSIFFLVHLSAPPFFYSSSFCFFPQCTAEAPKAAHWVFFFLLKEKNKAGGWLAFFTLSWAICRAALRKGFGFFFLLFSSFAASFFLHFCLLIFFYRVCRYPRMA